MSVANLLLWLRWFANTHMRIKPLLVLPLLLVAQLIADAKAADIQIHQQADLVQQHNIEIQDLMSVRAEKLEAKKQEAQKQAIVATPEPAQPAPAPAPVVAPAPAPKPVPARPVQASVPADKQSIMSAAGIAASDFAAVDFIISHESRWQHTVWNGTGSGAYGLCQSLPATKMASAGADYMTNPVTQLRWCNSYAVSRYGGWQGAAAAWKTKQWW